MINRPVAFVTRALQLFLAGFSLLLSFNVAAGLGGTVYGGVPPYQV